MTLILAVLALTVVVVLVVCWTARVDPDQNEVT